MDVNLLNRIWSRTSCSIVGYYHLVMLEIWLSVVIYLLFSTSPLSNDDRGVPVPKCRAWIKLIIQAFGSREFMISRFSRDFRQWDWQLIFLMPCWQFLLRCICQKLMVRLALHAACRQNIPIPSQALLISCSLSVATSSVDEC